MKKSRTSKFYFRFSCMDVYNAVVADPQNNEASYIPIDDKEYEKQKANMEKGQMIARVTDRTPGKSCAYELHAPNYDVFWSASFEEVQGECRMIMTETYVFPKEKFFQYILALLFLKQKEQHKEYFRSVNDRLKLEAYRRTPDK